MVLMHGGDLTLAPTLKPVIPAGQDGAVRAFDWLSANGFRCVQLDASVPGLRPRELSERARKDLMATLARRGLSVGGVDLFVPRKHFTDPVHVDRAVSAVVDAIGLAHDLGRVAVHMGLPIKTAGDDVKRAILEAADGRGVRLAVHAEDQMSLLTEWVAKEDSRRVGVCFDPATVMAVGGDPVKLVHQNAKALAGARLSDAVMDAEAAGESGSVGSGVRCPVGEGELDVVMYRLALDLAKERPGPVVLDLRGLIQPLAGAMAGMKAWSGAGV